MNGVKMNHSFIDEKNILHIWDWCAKEHTGKRFYKRSNVDTFDFTICDGLHMEEPTTIDKKEILRKNQKKSGTSTPLGEIVVLVKTHVEYLFRLRELVNNLQAINTELMIELTSLQLENKALSEEYSSVKREHEKLLKLEKQMQKRIKERTEQILFALNMRKDIILDNLTAAEILSNTPNISDAEMRKLLTHMKLLLLKITHRTIVIL
jgi:hypothetical protein